GIDVFLGLKVTSDDAGAICEIENTTVGGKLVFEVSEEALAKVLEVFHVGFAHLAEEQALEAGHALAIVGAHLGEEPVAFAAAACAAVADCGWAVGVVAEPGGSARGQLAWLEDEARAHKILHLFGRTSGLLACGEVMFQLGHGFRTQSL